MRRHCRVAEAHGRRAHTSNDASPLPPFLPLLPPEPVHPLDPRVYRSLPLTAPHQRPGWGGVHRYLSNDRLQPWGRGYHSKASRTAEAGGHLPRTPPGPQATGWPFTAGSRSTWQQILIRIGQATDQDPA